MRKTPRERFQKVSIDRAENLIRAIKLWGNTANRFAYEYEKKEIEIIYKTIKKELDKACTKFLLELIKKERSNKRKAAK